MTPQWMTPTLDEVRTRREDRGCGMDTAKRQLIHERIKREMPGIRRDCDFERLFDVVNYLVSRDQPPTY